VTRVQSSVFLATIAAAAVLFFVQQHQQATIRADNETLRRQLDQLSSVTADNERLSNAIVQATQDAADHTSELLKLRSEVTTLRRQTNELTALTRQNEQLRARGSDNSGGRQPPPDVPPQDIHPKENWVFSGYATPENALQSLLYGASQGDTNMLFAALAPEAFNELRKQMDKDKDRHIEDVKREMAQTVDFRITKREPISDDAISLGVYVNGRDHHAEDLVFVRINGEWKLTERGKDGVPPRASKTE
jgi:hypothetical protein